MAKGIIHDDDILTARAEHPITGAMHFERTYQQFRLYYRLCHNGNRTAGLTDAAHARETIAYWQSNGWTR